MSDETTIKDIKSIELPDEVIEAELGVIRTRRQSVYGDDDASKDEAFTDGSDLRGLSISGGGIRSSTFSIGVIQSLAKKNIFKDFDYISTVSGGGYTGSMISTLLNEPERTPSNFPLEMPVGDEESSTLQHLRNGSNYLTPGGFLEFVRLPAVVVRGLLLNLLLILPYIMLAVWLTEVIHEFVPVLNIYPWLESKNGGLYTFWGVSGLVCYFLLSGFKSINANWKRRNSYELWVARALILVVFLVLLGPFSFIVDWAINEPWHSLRDDIRQQFTIVSWAIAGGISVLALIMIKAAENLANILSKLALILMAVLGPGIIFAAYVLLVVAQVDSPFIEFSRPLANSEVPAPNTATQIILDKSQIDAFYEKDVDLGWSSESTREIVPAFYCGLDAWLIRNPAEEEGLAESYSGTPMQADCAYMGTAIEEHRLLRLQPRKVWPLVQPITEDDIEPNTYYELRGARLRLGGDPSDSALMNDEVFLFLTFVLFILNYFFINVNQSSLHGFYRDRLSALYLFTQPNEDKQVVPKDILKLSELNDGNPSVPYHIVNTTLNLQGDVDESQRGRDSDFFFFSKEYCGGTHTGYCPTTEMEGKDKHLNLGTAMAISAAAAAPNMGSTTNRSLIFILTLMNMRLGYWVPNPKFINEKKYISKPWSKFLWREAMGNLTAKTKLVNVSDGGHLENLAIYEMLRRRCKTILCIDGEADPTYTFNGLITLIRIARIDLGIEIKIDLDSLRLVDGKTKAHFVSGDIIYGGNLGVGTLIYVKSSYNQASEDNPFLRKYKADNPAFPHESTADQFFDERQFEAYRALGESVGRDLIAEIERPEGRIKWPVEISS